MEWKIMEDKASYEDYDFKGKLENGILKVTFIKTSELEPTKRVMRCTRNMDLIPEEYHPKGTKKVKENEDVVKAFDFDKAAWRSFNRFYVLDVEELSQF